LFFFVIISLIFIAKDKLSYKAIFVSLLFLNIAHGIRFESWILLPLIWFLIISKPISLNKKMTFMIASVLFPIYWMYLGKIYSGNYLYFFKQKYELAQYFQSPIYFNLNLSMLAWKNKLIPIFPSIFIFLAFFDFKNLLKNNTAKNIFYYFLPIFMYISLIAQVFFGTMEWFPTRYLLISTTFLIPLLASSIFEITKSVYCFFNKQNLINKLYSSILLLIFIFFLQNKYFESLKYTKLEITDWSLLQSYNSHETIKDSLLYANFSELIENCNQICKDEIVFFYEEKNRSYLDQGLFYFLNKPGVDIHKDDIDKYIKNNASFVWEKSFDDEIDITKYFKIIYENEKFYILETKSNVY